MSAKHTRNGRNQYSKEEQTWFDPALLSDQQCRQLLDFMAPLISTARADQLKQVLQKRTEYLTVVLENLWNPQNTSAVARTCECLGLQEMHTIEQDYQFRVCRAVTRGATQWLTVHRYQDPRQDNTANAIQAVKAKGYTLIATSPAAEQSDLDQIPIDQPMAVCFGSERTGLTEQMIANADRLVKLPMYGFTESYNISVAVAMIMSQLNQRLRRSPINCQLSPRRQLELLVDWYRLSMPTPRIWRHALAHCNIKQWQCPPPITNQDNPNRRLPAVQSKAHQS